jgi:hypothetical protein
MNIIQLEWKLHSKWVAQNTKYHVTIYNDMTTQHILTFDVFNVHGSVHDKNILIYIQQDETLHSLFYLETALHGSGGTTTHQEERKQLYLQHLVFITPLLLSAAIAADSSNGVTNTRCCRYSCLCSWWWVVVPPKTCRAVSRQNKLCNVASCWIYSRISWQLLYSCLFHALLYESIPFIRLCIQLV